MAHSKTPVTPLAKLKERCVFKQQLCESEQTNTEALIALSRLTFPALSRRLIDFIYPETCYAINKALHSLKAMFTLQLIPAAVVQSETLQTFCSFNNSSCFIFPTRRDCYELQTVKDASTVRDSFRGDRENSERIEIRNGCHANTS